MTMDLEKLLWLSLEFDFANFQQEIKTTIQALRLGWLELRGLECAAVSTDPSYSREIRFLVCNWDHLRIVGLLFLAFFALPLFFRVLVGIVHLVVLLLSLFGRVLAKVFSFGAEEEIDRAVVEEAEKEEALREKIEEQAISVEERDVVSFGREEWQIVLKIRKFGERLSAFQKDFWKKGMRRIKWRFLREMLFFERSDENLAGPMWSTFFLFSAIIPPLIGFSFLIPFQLFMASLVGFYAVYRVVRYKVLLDPNMSYYWEGKRGLSLYILAGSLFLLYITISLTAYFLAQIIWFG